VICIGVRRSTAWGGLRWSRYSQKPRYDRAPPDDQRYRFILLEHAEIFMALPDAMINRTLQPVFA
jgi:hypothetical protein